MRPQASPFAVTLPSGHHFFGLNYDYNRKVYEQIFDLCFYGQGGFHFFEVMEMPVNLRAFYYAKMAKILEERNQQIEAANAKGR